jgi:hypothetical protein
MMNVTTGEVRKLVEHRASPCVSVYMTTDPVWPGGPADKVRLCNLLRDAARRLARAHEPEEIEQLLVPVAERVRERWPPRGRGIALLRSPDVNVSFDLPVEVPDLAVVASTFHTKPLLGQLDRDRVDKAELEHTAAARWLSFRRAGMATDVLSEVITAAAEGRVRQLLHREGTHLWGRMDLVHGTFVLRAGEEDLEPGDSDLIDDLCELTLVKGGEVVEIAPERMPTEVPVAAVLRY